MAEKWWKIPDWWMVILTLTAAVLAGLSAWFIKLQLDDANKTARLEQQAWIQLSIVGDKIEISPNVPLAIQVRETNTGKIPASKLNTDILIEFVDKDRPPTFDFRHAHGRSYGGVLFPSAKIDNPVAWIPPESTSLGPPPPLAQSTYDRLLAGEAYVAVSAQVTYTDAYGDHWLNWCSWQGFWRNSQFTAKACTDFNEVSPN